MTATPAMSVASSTTMLFAGRVVFFATAFVLAAACGVLPSVARAQSEIAKTVHNLTPEGTGAQKETRKTGLCVFCHTPHNSNPSRSLWNKDLPGITYQLYTSTTLRADLKQPTGSSRLCLSCHDGFVAMGNLRVPPPGDPLKLGAMTGPNVLGTDLSDDHPISFVYDSALAAKHPGIIDPGNLPKELPLDRKKEMQCTTCHNPHESNRGKFLRTDNPSGAMCLACHDPIGWRLSSHAISPATWMGGGLNPWPAGSATTVAANACRNCHRTHSAPHGERLLARAQEPDNCNICHGGTVAKKNIAAEFANGAKFSRHPIESAQWTHSPVENPAGMPRHVACEDCHNPHAATARTAVPPLVAGPLTGVTGVAAGGVPVQEATFEFQVCSKCHGFREPATPGITRVEATRIVSTKIDPSNQSFHPIAAAGRNSTIRGLVPGLSATTIIGCTDCHNNNEWQTPTGIAPRGPHASRYAPILQKYYQTTDNTPESTANYDLCYKCHDRATLLAPGGFPHYLHAVQQQAPCAACHDAHGSRQSPHLINFMTQDINGKIVVQPNSQGQLQYVAGPNGTGSCSLLCHGRDHAGLSYGLASILRRR
jgi:predicted CXXCH cytochrome family protein